jgi:FtsP/CotA-like multicopper oxidase with cupredoxin domain
MISADQVSQPEGWDDDLRLPEAEDLNPDPHVLEINLEARTAELEILPGVKTEAWTYNGMLPGPLIRARVGDRLIVHFTNSLPEATTIHWHGVRVPNAMDGAPGLTQDPIPPGGTFTYDFVLKDAGLFWYHPHFNSPRQVAAGLYGAILVEDPKDPVDVDGQAVVVLSDIALTPDGSLKPADRGGVFGDLFGREGDYLLVNGKVRPTIKARAGKPQRWRVLNAAITRYFPIALRYHHWVRLGGDGGLAERPEELPRLALAPAERADLIFTPTGDPGSTQTMYWLPVDRGGGTSFGAGRTPLLDIAVAPEPAVTPPAMDKLPGKLRDIPAIDISHAVERRLELTIDNDAPREDMMGINGEAHHHMIEARLGETDVWEVVNTTDFDHPFHLHGYFFQVLDDRIPEWKDTVNVPAHQTKRLAVVFDERPGTWMFHCHILDHAEVGMMGHLMVK